MYELYMRTLYPAMWLFYGAWALAVMTCGIWLYIAWLKWYRGRRQGRHREPMEDREKEG